MKLTKILGVTLIALSAFTFTACQKESVGDAQSNENQLDGARNSGVVADNPADVARVPVVVSAEFARNGIFTQTLADETAAKGKPVKTADRIAPLVTITSPASGSSVSGVTTISAIASDNVAVKSVTFTVNNGSSVTRLSAPYSTEFNFVNDGSYTITAKAVDAAGNAATHSIVVSKTTVIIVPPPPTTTLPSSKLLITPPVMSQGGEGSCLSMALAAQLSIERFYITRSSSYSNSTNIVSPEFLYNQTKVADGCGSGAAMLNSMSFIQANGICSWNSLPYSSLNGCDPSIITSAMRSEALLNKISSYNYMLASDATAIKTSLVNNHPVSFTFQMDSNFYNATAGYIWNSRGTMMYTHAMVIVGYDDAKRAYKAQNAWGTSWGDQGFIWIDYNFFPTVAGYVYAMN